MPYYTLLVSDNRHVSLDCDVHTAGKVRAGCPHGGLHSCDRYKVMVVFT